MASQPPKHPIGEPPSLGDVRCHRILLGIAVSFLLVCTISLFLWIILRPQSPVFSVSSAAVSEFNLSSPSDADALFSSTFEITLSASNPNKKMAIGYDRVSAAVAYGGHILAETTLPPFRQGKGNSATLRATMAAAEEYVGSALVTSISGDRAKDGAVGFQVLVKASVSYRMKAWMMSRSLMRVYCGDVRIAFRNMTTTFGSMVRPLSYCQVSIWL